MRQNPGKIGLLIQAVREVTSAPAYFWDRGASWFVVWLYVMEAAGDELQRFIGGDSLAERLEVMSRRNGGQVIGGDSRSLEEGQSVVGERYGARSVLEPAA